MRTKSRTRSRGLVLAVLSLAVFLPELAHAQQTGLFPVAPSRFRQRVPCDQELPAYKIVKEKYFGHHPTAWRPFPEGWALKSKQSPDVEKSFKDLPLQTGDEPAQDDRDTEEGMRPQPGQPRQTLPPLPGGGRSPFDLDSPDTGGVRPGGQPGQPRPALPPAGDPFDLDKPDTPKANAPAGGQNRPTPSGASIGPGLSAPAERTGQYRSNRRPADDEPEPQEDDGPLLALPNINLPPIANPAFASATQPTPTTAMAATTATASATDESPATSADAAPPPRRGFLSGLLNNLGWIRR